MTNWVYQLVDQGLLERSPGDRPLLCLNDAAWEVMRGGRSVSLMRVQVEKTAKTRTEREAWEGVDVDLFEHLREVRRALATEREVPAFVIFSDKTLRDMARIRPASRKTFKLVHGIGAAKLEKFGELFLQEIHTFAKERGLDQDCGVEAAPVVASVSKSKPKRSAAKQTAFDLFASGESIETVADQLNRKPSTIVTYLSEYIEYAKPTSIDSWIHESTYQRIADVAPGSRHEETQTNPRQAGRRDPPRRHPSGGDSYGSLR